IRGQYQRAGKLHRVEHRLSDPRRRQSLDRQRHGQVALTVISLHGAPNHKTKTAQRTAGPFVSIGGANRDRTGDLYNAIVALSQLSYGPMIWRPAAAPGGWKLGMPGRPTNRKLGPRPCSPT